MLGVAARPACAEEPRVVLRQASPTGGTSGGGGGGSCSGSCIAGQHSPVLHHLRTWLGPHTPPRRSACSGGAGGARALSGQHRPSHAVQREVVSSWQVTARRLALGLGWASLAPAEAAGKRGTGGSECWMPIAQGRAGSRSCHRRRGAAAARRAGAAAGLAPTANAPSNGRAQVQGAPGAHLVVQCRHQPSEAAPASLARCAAATVALAARVRCSALAPCCAAILLELRQAQQRPAHSFLLGAHSRSLPRSSSGG